MKAIELAPTLSLPADLAGSQKYAFIARSGGGKSYAASKLAELLHGAGVPVIVLDPVGVWWGLRLAADGVGPGLPIPVIGGQHGDVALRPDGGHGEPLARWLIETNGSAVLDISEMRKNERKRFVAAFLEELFEAAKGARRPRMLVLEEAQKFAPQQAKGQEVMLGAVEDWVRLARNYGGGVMLLSQRPQSVNKEVLNQAECLFVGQLGGKHEREAVRDWVVEKGGKNEALEQLPFLDVGELVCYSPQWLKVLGKVRVFPKQTYDASATPLLGEDAPEALASGSLAPVDLEALRALMAPAPPKEPRGRARKAATAAKVETVAARVDHAAELANALKAAELEKMRRKLSGVLATLRAAVTDATRAEQALAELLGEPLRNPSPIPDQSTEQEELERTYHANETAERTSSLARSVARVPKASSAKGWPQALSRAEAAILAAFDGHHELDRVRLALRAGYAHKSSTYANALGVLRTAGYLEQGSPVRITPSGRARSRGLPAPRGGVSVFHFWSGQLGGCARVLLREIKAVRIMGRDELAKATNYRAGSSTYANALGELRRYGLVSKGSPIRLTEQAAAEIPK